MLHEQDSSHLANIPASPASLHLHCGLRLSSAMLTKFPCTLYKQTKLIPSPFLKNGPLTLLKPKLVFIALGENTFFKKHFFFFFFQKENPYQCLLILTQSEAGWFRSILPAGQFLPLGFLSDTRNWELLSSFEGSSATLRHDLFQLSWWLIGPCCFPSHANGSFNSTVK